MTRPTDPKWRLANGAVQAGTKDAWRVYMDNELRAAHGGRGLILDRHLAAVIQRHGLIPNG